MPNYAVIVTYDRKQSELLPDIFHDPVAAINFMKSESQAEYEDQLANGFDAEYAVYENEGRAVLTMHWDDGDSITEWQVGKLCEPKEEEE